MQNEDITTRTFGQSIRQVARSFLHVLGEVATRVDELSLEDKQPFKDMLVTMMPKESAKLLTRDDDELRRTLSDRGWWVLQKDINGPVKRELLRLRREGKSSEIDAYICSLFKEANEPRLQKKIEGWFDVPYLNERKPLILDSFDAHKTGKWTLSIPALLPLVDGLTRKFRKNHLRASQNPGRAIHIDKFADYYRKKQPRLFGESFASFVRQNMYAKFDFVAGAPPSSINRHGVLHGEIRDYATEANSLRVFLLLDTIAQFVRAFEKRRNKPAIQ
jgi:hypothetical protein